MITHWTVKRSGIIAPDERLPWGPQIVLALQHAAAMFGSTVVAPLIMGFPPTTALFFSGVATLIFFVVTAGRVPSYLGSSFAFIAPVLAITGGHGSISAALGGIVAAGIVYAVIGLLVHVLGASWIEYLMPPVVTGSVVIVIGLTLAGAARNLAAADVTAAILTILAIFAVGLYTRGLFARLPILLGTVIGYLLTLLLGGTAGRNYGPVHIGGVDLSPIARASWLGLPTFTTPTFSWHAIALLVPVVVVLIAENTGHIKAVSAITGRDLNPYLGRSFLGDGLATIVSGSFGGTGVTTYAENIGALAVSKTYSTLLFPMAAVVAILLGISPKFGAVLQSIPSGVLGGASTVLFGLIAATGIRILIQNDVDLSRVLNLLTVGTGVVLAAGGYDLVFGSFDVGNLTLSALVVILLYLIFRHAPDATLIERDLPADAAVDTP